MGSTGFFTYAHQRERPGEGHMWNKPLKYYASTPGSEILHFEESRGWPGNYSMKNKQRMEDQLAHSKKVFNNSSFVGVQQSYGYYKNVVKPKLNAARDPEIRGQFPGALGTLPSERTKWLPPDYRCYPINVGPDKDLDISTLAGMRKRRSQKYWWHPSAVDAYATTKKKVQDRYI